MRFKLKSDTSYKWGDIEGEPGKTWNTISAVLLNGSIGEAVHHAGFAIMGSLSVLAVAAVRLCLSISQWKYLISCGPS